ncbi:unnamed protein product [Euphydryas editha]|uniref:Pentraxin (PTX) domain-containing protein n=1 Tax=Euphydryas editha TaxID=104508 RepID=A0AAU9UUT1_EUPED|nr:unnamed protein product [Euphydryas editha]
MMRFQYLVLAVILSADAINRPVYKIVLTQKGFAQFLQYDVESPPIREFTFCTWLRFFDLAGDQSVFTYVANGNSRVVRLWLGSGGRHIKISMNGQTPSSAPVDITKNTWRHICLSYQSDFGAWALYVDGRLTSCEAAQSLHGFVIPGGGSIVIGYGITDAEHPNGFEGEIFGANMILASTIERNYTIKTDPKYRQKSFNKNKLLGNKDIKYVVLSDLEIDTIQETSEAPKFSPYNTTRNFIKFTTPYSAIEHDVGLDLSPLKIKLAETSNEKEILDFPVMENRFKGYNEKNSFWTLMNNADKFNKLKEKNRKNVEQSRSGTQELPTISQYETPPPPTSFQDYVRSNLNMKKPTIIPYFEIKKYEKPNHSKSVSNQNLFEVSDVEKPPPFEKNSKVYGQWTSSQFANSVLNYIKSFNDQYKEKRKIPSTIPLIKFSDSFPYASDFKLTQVRPPFSEQRKNFLYKRIDKRDVKQPEFNVKIIHDDIRSQILESHSKTQAKNVKVINRGIIDSSREYRINRDVDNQLTDEIRKPRPFVAASKTNSNKIPTRLNLYRNRDLMTILPFLKSTEYFTEGNSKKKSSNSHDIYTKTLSNANKWHNVKSFNSDYTPRHINMESDENEVTIDSKIAEVNKKYPSVRLKYMPNNHKVVKNVDEETIINARALATEISNLSNTHTDSVSILKYNHGFLPTNNKNTKLENKLNLDLKNNDDAKRKIKATDNFNHNVKIGNALNERFIIGNNEQQNQISFIGGDEKIPDINRYRSEIDQNDEKVPPSLVPKICKNVELYDRLFYIQPDGSVDVTQILSPVKGKNLGIEFITQNYKKCSLEESIFRYSPLLFIDWSTTPVRLFGGAYPKKTKDLCGFF